MKRLLATAALALSMGLSIAAANAAPSDEHMARGLVDAATSATEHSNPTFSCYDPTNKASCQTIRAANSDGGSIPSSGLPTSRSSLATILTA